MQSMATDRFRSHPATASGLRGPGIRDPYCRDRSLGHVADGADLARCRQQTDLSRGHAKSAEGGLRPRLPRQKPERYPDMLDAAIRSVDETRGDDPTDERGS